ncbi:hypothetical protein ES288_D06G169400v1 [Gossypium darwinii]|uniref:Uncharacterized protein n=2 Tax=Gossypium TaxID=3633 RepID=A0A5D2C6K2_GOSDA|nr:hypothetical protein ES288_D06G169400v1 [Gossypium darwinii]TYG65232.1 hypothetical protein ES288_D06G169400v1 [Gossypium darwinii]TYH67198.1 hypothetical protein ES332_D06G171800v1 [Gossypium tomentosum]
MLSGAATRLPILHDHVFLLSLPTFLFFLLSSFPSLFSPHCQLLLFRLSKTDFSFLGITKVSNGFLWVLPCRGLLCCVHHHRRKDMERGSTIQGDVFTCLLSTFVSTC